MKRQILVVDDNLVNRQVLTRMLRGQYDVLEAENGEAALYLLRQKANEISAVLLDIVMPVMDGYAVLEKMRESPVLSQIPVIVTTSNTEMDAQIKALSCGANDYIVKPYNPSVIVHRLFNTIRLRETAALANAARRDDLTGLLNRKAFFEDAERLIAEKPPGFYVIACFDVDNFKVVNDQYGTVKGDEVLKQIAQTFRAGFEPVGGLCARVTADNFAVLYPRSFMDTEDLRRIREQASRLDGSIQPLVFSIGRYVAEDLSLSVSAMYDRATLARACVKGRFDKHIALYNESMREKLIREQKIVTQMNDALKSGQFEVWFQPQYNHATGALIGSEALVRWRRDGVLVSPDEFIPVFERNGFIYEMDKFVWEQVCRLLRKWLDAKRSPLPVSVNVSRYDVFRDDFFQVITGLLRTYDLPVDLLRLEITESAFAQSADQIIAMVRRLIDYGFVIEIDDFGSGYSSLNTLKDVPAAILKLDMKFLEKGWDKTRGGNILESVVRMAKWLNMRVIAEGVETLAQADYLCSIGCNYVQGYLYSRPIPAGEYERLAADTGKEHRMEALETLVTLDNNAFWNPQGQETLIFNSYVGGACIFEVHEGKSELLRVNEKYARELGENLSIADALKIDVTAYMDDENRAIIRRNIQNAIDTNDESACEVLLTDLPGAPKRLFLRACVRLIARAGNRMLFYCSIINVTRQHEDKEQILQTAGQLRQLNETAHELLAQPDTDAGIESVLKKMLSYFGGSRAHVVELDDERLLTQNTFEVCAPGVESRKSASQRVPFTKSSAWYRLFSQNAAVNIVDAEALGEERLEEKRFLEKEGVKSQIAVSMTLGGRFVGYVAVDNPHRHQSQAEHLRAIGDYIALMIARRDQNREIARAGEEKLRRERDEEIKTVRMNERVLRMVAVHSNRTVYRYDVATGSAYADFDATSNRAAPAFGVNLPESAIERGLVLPKSWDAFRGVFRDIQAGKPDGGAKLSMRTADGEPIWMDMRYSILEYAGGRPVTAALTFANITDEHEKLMVYERYRQLIEEENNREGVVWFETDLTSDVVEKMGTNVSFADFPPCGSRHMDAVNYGVENLMAEKDRAWARTYLSRERLIASFRTGVKTLSTDLPVRAPGQPDQYYRVNIQMVKDPYSGHIHAYTTLRDVTREREAEITAKRLSETDGMTGLYNKTTAEEMIREKLARPGRTPCALLIADLDDLKAINDRFGHDRGDEAIRFIASSLRAQFRRTDIVGRVGGDEFIAFLEGVGDEKKLREMIETLLGRLRAARFGPQMEQSIAGSVGIAIGVMGEDRFETLFKRADLALYFVKRNGKNGFAVYTPDMEKT